MPHLKLLQYRRAQQQLVFYFQIDAFHFSTTYWYEKVHLPQLEQQFGLPFMEKIYFHIAAFEMTKIASLAPDSIDFGILSRYCTPAFEKLWRTCFQKIWAQWRYEHQLPNYQLPILQKKELCIEMAPIQIPTGSTPFLLFCGGGKDSLLAMKLLERSDIQYDVYSYSHNVYGNAEPQHALIEQLLQHTQHQKQHKHWVYDVFLDAPVPHLATEYNIKKVTSCETPSSLFGVLPVVLQEGYEYLVLAHEKSADFGNLIWEITQEEINHQWGKSFEAEKLLSDYVQNELITNVHYFSLLKPFYDPFIFFLLRNHLTALQDAHSCNLKKPWCYKCPKCAYVLTHYLAYFGAESVQKWIEMPIFDLEENQLWFRQLLGLEAHTPFECVGQADEMRLAMSLCHQKSYTGKSMDTFLSACEPIRVQQTVDKLFEISSQHRIPPFLWEKLGPFLESEAATAKKRISKTLNGANSAD